MFWLGLVIGIILTSFILPLIGYINNLARIKKATIKKIKQYDIQKLTHQHEDKPE